MVPRPRQQVQLGQQPRSRPKFGLQQVSEWLKHPLIVAVIGALIGAGLTLGIPQIFRTPGPPPIITITVLMDQEVQAALTHDTGLVVRIYDAHAVVMDAGCQSPSQGYVWSGLTSIMARYSALPQFASLKHVDPQVSWVPDDASATTAYVSATTIGVLVGGLTGGSSQPIRGHEQWAFSKSTGRWVITLFTYNLCLP